MSTVASAPPQNPDAELSVLGALLRSAEEDTGERRLADVRAAGLLPADFFSPFNGRVFRALVDAADAGEPFDAVSVSHRLNGDEVFEEKGGRDALVSLAWSVSAVGNVVHHARIVHELAEKRAAWKPSEAGDDLCRFPGHTHAELLKLDVLPANEIVAGIVEAGTVGTIAGLPETFKSWLALALTFAASTGGSVLGRKVLQSRPCAYWWQDDSTANELHRIKAYANRHGLTETLPIRWHLNEGLALPGGIQALRDEIVREGLELVVLDSLYNFLPGIGLKDEDVAVVLRTLKADVCDVTGCAICVVDHSPWPTESNKGQRRSYGSVFKAAAIRWGIYLDREAETLYVEARGNNVTGMKRTAVVWNPERLELSVVEPVSPTENLGKAIEDFLRRNPGATTTFVRSGVTGRDKAIDRLLRDDPRFTTVPPALFGKPRNTTCWALMDDVPDLLQAGSDGSR